jgi:hypothetical protein
MDKKKILFIFNGPINSITDLKNYIFLSKDIFSVYFIGYNGKESNYIVDNVNIISIEGNGSGILGRLRLFGNTLVYLSKIKPDLIFIPYFLGCSLFRIFHKKSVLDIRSGTIHANSLVRFLKNKLIRLESFCFDYRFVISGEVNEYLGLSGSYFRVPLGSTSLGYSKKVFDKLSLLYVGTFHLRNLSVFIKALSFVYYNCKFDFEKFVLIGFGSDEEIGRINSSIKESKLTDKIFFLGEIRPPEIYRYFKECNVGISFVPDIDYFYYQPPTKTYEYLMSGMAVMATPNSINIKLINNTNGVIFDDNFIGCVAGLNVLYSTFTSFNSDSIVNNPNLYSWDEVVKLFFIPAVNKIINES